MAEIRVPRATRSMSAPSWPSSSDGAAAAARAGRRSAPPPPSAAPAAAAPPRPAPAPPRLPAAPAPARAPSPPLAAADTAVTDGKVLSPVVRRSIGEYGIDPTRSSGHRPRWADQPRRCAALHRVQSGSAVGTSRRSSRPRPRPSHPPLRPRQPAPRALRAGRPLQPRSPVAALRQAGARDAVVPLSNIRLRTGEHMVMSKSVAPHTLTAIEVDYEGVEQSPQGARRELQGSRRASASPTCRSSPGHDRCASGVPAPQRLGRRRELIVHNYVNLAVAVDLDFQGCLPRSSRRRRQAHALDRSGHRRLAPRARSKQLSPDELSGGTFTLTNAGSYGTMMQFPIINQPQVAILSTDGIKRKPVVIEDDYGNESSPFTRSACWPWLGIIEPSTAPTPRPSWPDKEISRLGMGPSWPSRVTREHHEHRHDRHVGDSDRLQPCSVRGWARCRTARPGTCNVAVRRDQDHLLLCEHPPVFTFGVAATTSICSSIRPTVGAEVYRVDRGGDVTFHGPGQLVGYPVMSVAGKRGGGMADTVAYVSSDRAAHHRRVPPTSVSTAGRIDRHPGSGSMPTGPGLANWPPSVSAEPWPLDARLRTQRRCRPRLVPAHRPVRDRRQGRDLSAAEGVDASMAEVVDLVDDRRPDPRRRPAGRTPRCCVATSVARTWPHFHGRRARRSPKPTARAGRAPPRRRLDGGVRSARGRLAEAGVRREGWRSRSANHRGCG